MADGILALAEPEEQPLLAPVAPTMSWATVHAMTQTPLRAPTLEPMVEPVTIIRRTATIRRGTRMIKLLSARQIGAYLHGRRPNGFCYRAFDLAALRSLAELAALTGEHHPDGVVYGLRWRAIDPADYDIPFSLPVGDLPAYGGLSAIAPHDRVGPQVLGTGFAPSSQHVIPEFVTTDLADLPLPAASSLVAFGPDGTEVSLYMYIPEQRAWTRMFGPAARHLVAGLPEISPDQEYVQFATDHTGGSSLVGRYGEDTYEALADPPHDFRILAKARAARYPVEQVARRIRYATWRGVECTVVRVEGDWIRVRVCRPDADTVPSLGVTPIERGIYEAWAPVAELTDVRDVDTHYSLT